jgi:hypothetical protein
MYGVTKPKIIQRRNVSSYDKNLENNYLLLCILTAFELFAVDTEIFILRWLVIRNICMSLFQAFLNTAALTGRLFLYVRFSFEFGL